MICRGAIAVVVLFVAAGCGGDRTAELLADRAAGSTTTITPTATLGQTSTSAFVATTRSTAASSTTLAASVLAVGATVDFEQRFDGVPNIAKITLQSTQWTATRGPAGGSNPSNGAYLIVTARVECVTGVCQPGAGHFIFRGADGRLYYPFGPGANGHVPALGYGQSPYQPDLARPITAGQSVSGIAAIDAPRVGGTVYLVGVNALATVTTFPTPHPDLRGTVAAWRIDA